MTVHKKHPAAEEPLGKEEKKVEAKPEVVGDPVVVSDVITQTERIEIIEEIPAPKSSEEDPLGDFKEKVQEELSSPDDSHKKNYMWPILMIFIIAVLLLAGAFLYKSQSGNSGDEKVNIVTITQNPTATPEPAKTLDLTKYEIAIQNGSGVAGEASRQKANLETEGFVVSSVGNADNSDYVDTIIQAKKEVEKEFITKLETVLGATFTVGETEELPEDSSSSIIVILGTKK